MAITETTSLFRFRVPPLRFVLIFSALIAAGAFYPHHSYNYFVLLKCVLFATSIWAAIIEGENKRIFGVVAFVAVAIIHNPIMRFYFERNTWLVIDGVTAAWLVFRAITMNSKNSKK